MPNNRVKRFIFSFFCLFLLGGDIVSAQEIDTSRLRISRISIEGNRTTKPYVVYRELVFSEGDFLSLETLEKKIECSKHNLVNTSLFAKVDIREKVDADSTNVEIDILLEEQWYFFPFPTIDYADRNVNNWLQNPRLSRLSLGVDTWVYNCRGRNEDLHIKLSGGYDQSLLVDYTVPFLDKSLRLGFAMGGFINFSHEIPVNLHNNRMQYVSSPEGFVFKDYGVHLEVKYRQKIYVKQHVKLRYRQVDVADTVFVCNPFFAPQRNTRNLELSYGIKHDHRDFATYPLNGYYWDADVKAFFPMMSGSNTVPYLTLRTTYRRYWELSSRWSYAFAVNAFGCSTSEYPFYLRQAGLGFNRFYVRGYAPYVMKAQAYVFERTNLKYLLLPEKTFEISGVKSPFFNKIPVTLFLNLFLDAGYTYDTRFDQGNLYTNRWIYGYGLGLDLLTYYQRVFRVEVAMNHANQLGLYFAFEEPL